MTSVAIYESHSPLVEEDIAEVEQQLGVIFPPDYRAFLLAHNGGYPDPNVFPISGLQSDDHGILEWFFCIQAGDYNDLIRNTSTFRGRVPPNLIPIASDPGGNLICLSVTGRDVGTVYYWDHEEEVDEGEPPDYTNVYFIADSFSTLLDSLKALPE